MIRLKFLLYIFLILQQCSLFSDIIGSQDSLKFKVESQGEAVMTLNSNGLGLGTSPSANLHVKGSLAYNYQVVSSNTLLSGNSYILVDTSGDNISLTLPYAGNVDGRVYRIKKTIAENYLLVSDSDPVETKEYIFYPSIAEDSLPYAEFMSFSNSWKMLSRNQVSERWDPTVSSNVVLWFDASDSTSLSVSASSNVTQWNDKSGNDYHVSQSTEGSHPQTGTRTINDLNVLDFDGSTQRLLRTSDVLVSNQSYTKILVYSVDTLGALNNLVTIGQTAFYQELSMWHNNTQFASSSYPGISTPMIAMGSYESNVESNIYINGSNVGSNSSPGTWSNDSNYLKIASHGGGSLLNGVIAEILVLDYAVDADLRVKIEGYLAWKWGLKSNLNSNHIYRDAPAVK